MRKIMSENNVKGMCVVQNMAALPTAAKEGGDVGRFAKTAEIQSKCRETPHDVG